MNFTTLPESPCPEVKLRHITADDIAQSYAYLSDPVVVEHTSWNVSSPDDLAASVWDADKNTPDRSLKFAIARREDDVLVGTIGFHAVSSVNATAELGYELAPALWGRGLATTLCKALVAWGHEQAGLVRIQAVVLDSNTRSERVLLRCGFQHEGLLRSYRKVRGTPRDFVMYSHLTVD
jgi:[ribosomal protein S5]-alanine N-acetyltransferase